MLMFLCKKKIWAPLPLLPASHHPNSHSSTLETTFTNHHFQEWKPVDEDGAPKHFHSRENTNSCSMWPRETKSALFVQGSQRGIDIPRHETERWILMCEPAVWASLFSTNATMPARQQTTALHLLLSCVIVSCVPAIRPLSHQDTHKNLFPLLITVLYIAL